MERGATQIPGKGENLETGCSQCQELGVVGGGRAVARQQVSLTLPSKSILDLITQPPLTTPTTLHLLCSPPSRATIASLFLPREVGTS